MLAFGEIKPQLLILLIYPVGIICSRTLGIYANNNPYYYLFLFFISHFIALIPLLIIKIRNKKESVNNVEIQTSLNDTPNEQKNSINIFNEIKEKEENENKIRNKQKIIKSLIIGIFYFSTYAFFYYSNYIITTKFYGNISMITEVIYFSIFNWLILKKKSFAHHYFSMILISIGIIGLFILIVITSIKDDGLTWEWWKDFFLPTILNLVVYCPFCFFLVLTKYYMEKYFLSAYELIVILGIFCLTLLLIFEPITFFIPCKIEIMCYEGHFAGIISGFKKIIGYKDVLYSLGIIIGLFMTSLGLWLTVEYVSPAHFLTTDSIITFGLNILLDIYLKDGNLLLNNPLFYILSFITILGCLIYNEIIKITICKLDFNTRASIIYRQTIELKNDDNNSESSYNQKKDDDIDENVINDNIEEDN